MSKPNESHSLGRLAANLESDPDLYDAVIDNAVSQGMKIDTENLGPLKEQVFQMVQDALARYKEQNKPAAPARLLNALAEAIFRPLQELAQWQAPALSMGTLEASSVSKPQGEARTVRLSEVVDPKVLSEQVPWAGPTVRLWSVQNTEDQSWVWFALVESCNREVRQSGALEVTLRTQAGDVETVRLDARRPKRMFPTRDFPTNPAEIEYRIALAA